MSSRALAFPLRVTIRFEIQTRHRNGILQKPSAARVHRHCKRRNCFFFPDARGFGRIICSNTERLCFAALSVSSLLSSLRGCNRYYCVFSVGTVRCRAAHRSKYLTRASCYSWRNCSHNGISYSYGRTDHRHIPIVRSFVYDRTWSGSSKIYCNLGASMLKPSRTRHKESDRSDSYKFYNLIIVARVTRLL